MRLHPVVPLFGDIAISIQTILSKAPNIRNGKLDLEIKDPTVHESYMLLSNIDAARIEYKEVLNQINIARILVSKKVTTDSKAKTLR